MLQTRASLLIFRLVGREIALVLYIFVFRPVFCVTITLMQAGPDVINAGFAKPIRIEAQQCSTENRAQVEPSAIRQ